MSEITPNLEWQKMTLMQFLRSTTSIPQETPKTILEKELTEKQLFNKLKKEIKEVSVKLN